MSALLPKNELVVNAAAFEQDYDYGRPARLGLQPGFILGASVHVKQGTRNRSLKLIIGIGSLAVAEDGHALGGKVDRYVPLEGPQYKAVIEACEPAALKGGKVDLDRWTNKPVMVDVAEEVDKMKSAETGVEVKRLKIDAIFPAGTSEGQAQQYRAALAAKGAPAPTGGHVSAAAPVPQPHQPPSANPASLL